MRGFDDMWMCNLLWKRLSAKPFDACDVICRFDGGTWVAIVSLITVECGCTSRFWYMSFVRIAYCVGK